MINIQRVQGIYSGFSIFRVIYSDVTAADLYLKNSSTGFVFDVSTSIELIDATTANFPSASFVEGEYMNDKVFVAYGGTFGGTVVSEFQTRFAPPFKSREVITWRK